MLIGVLLGAMFIVSDEFVNYFWVGSLVCLLFLAVSIIRARAHPPSPPIRMPIKHMTMSFEFIDYRIKFTFSEKYNCCARSLFARKKPPVVTRI